MKNKTTDTEKKPTEIATEKHIHALHTHTHTRTYIHTQNITLTIFGDTSHFW